MSLRVVWAVVTSGVVSWCAFTGWLIGDWGGEYTTRLVDDIGLLGFAILAACCSCVAARHGRGRQRAAWVASAGGLFCWALGEAIWCYYELWLGLEQTPFPSPADAAFLLFPVGAGLALILFPVGHGSQSRVRLVLDGVIVAGSLFVVSWVSVLGNVYRAGAANQFALDVSLAYPVADLVTITMAIVVLARGRTAQRLTLRLLAVGILLMALSDSAFTYLTVLGAYRTGNLIDLGWAAAFLVLGGAGLASTREPQDLEPGLVPSPARLLLPYLPLLVAGGVAAARYWRSLDSGPLPVAGIVIVLGMLARQFIVVRENRRLLAIVADQALRDPLTGLANRRLFADRLADALRLRLRDGRPVAVLCLDLNGFKLVNDNLGHHAGDALLIQVAERLLRCLRTGDTAARMGGDEFAVLIEHDDYPVLIAERVVDAFDTAFVLDGHSLTVRPSIGLATAPRDAAIPPQTLLKQADLAMYSAKRAGSVSVHTFTAGMDPAGAGRGGPPSAVARAAGRAPVQAAHRPGVT